MIDRESSYIHFCNVYYCLELNSNLLSLGILKKKDFQFLGKQGLFSIIDNQRDIVLQAKRKSTVYLLLQPFIHQTRLLTNPIFKIIKPAIQNKWHPRKVYSDYRNLASLSKVTKKLELKVNITEQFPPMRE